MKLIWEALCVAVVVSVPAAASPLGQLGVAAALSAAVPRDLDGSWGEQVPQGKRRAGEATPDDGEWVWTSSGGSPRVQASTAVSQSRSLFTSLIAPFVGGRQRPRGGHRGREKPRPQVWRPAFTLHPPRPRPPPPTSHHPAGVPPQLLQSGLRDGAPHVFSAIHAPDITSADFPGYPETSLTVGDANSATPVTIDLSEFSEPRPEDVVYIEYEDGGDGANFQQNSGSFVQVSTVDQPNAPVSGFQPPREYFIHGNAVSAHSSTENVKLSEVFSPPLLNVGEKFSKPLATVSATENSLNFQNDNVLVTADTSVHDSHDEQNPPAPHHRRHHHQPTQPPTSPPPPPRSSPLRQQLNHLEIIPSQPNHQILPSLPSYSQPKQQTLSSSSRPKQQPPPSPPEQHTLSSLSLDSQPKQQTLISPSQPKQQPLPSPSQPKQQTLSSPSQPKRQTLSPSLHLQPKQQTPSSPSQPKQETLSSPSEPKQQTLSSPSQPKQETLSSPSEPKQQTLSSPSQPKQQTPPSPSQAEQQTLSTPSQPKQHTLSTPSLPKQQTLSTPSHPSQPTLLPSRRSTEMQPLSSRPQTAPPAPQQQAPPRSWVKETRATLASSPSSHPEGISQEDFVTSPAKRQVPGPGHTLPQTPSHGQRLPQTPGQGQRLQETPSHGQRLPQTPSHGQRLQETPSHGQRLPQTLGQGQRLQETPSHGQRLQETPSHGQRLQETPSHGQRLPQTPGQGQRLQETPSHGQRLQETPSHGQRLQEIPSHGQRLPQTPGHGHRPSQTPSNGHSSPQTPTLPARVREASSSSQEHPSSVGSFAPLPAFTQDELGSPAATTAGFLPFEDSSEFFDHVFEGRSPFGEKVQTEEPGSPSRPTSRPFRRSTPPLASTPTLHSLSYTESLSATLTPSYQTSSSSAIFPPFQPPGPSSHPSTASSLLEEVFTASANDLPLGTTKSPSSSPPWTSVTGPLAREQDRSEEEGTAVAGQFSFPVGKGGHNTRPATPTPTTAHTRPGRNSGDAPVTPPGIPSSSSTREAESLGVREKPLPVTTGSAETDDFDVLVLSYEAVDGNDDVDQTTTISTTHQPVQFSRTTKPEEVDVFLVRRTRPSSGWLNIPTPRPDLPPHPQPQHNTTRIHAPPTTSSHVSDSVTPGVRGPLVTVGPDGDEAPQHHHHQQDFPNTFGLKRPQPAGRDLSLDQDDHLKRPLNHDDHTSVLPLGHDDHDFKLSLSHDHSLDLPVDNVDHSFERPADQAGHNLTLPSHNHHVRETTAYPVTAAEDGLPAEGVRSRDTGGPSHSFLVSSEEPGGFLQVLGSLAPPPSSTTCDHGFCHDLANDQDNWWQDRLLEVSSNAAIFTYSELHSPANDSLFYDPPQPHDRYVCGAEVRELRPAWGRAADGNFLRIINTDAFPQRIRMEVCSGAGERCAFLPELVASACRQRYSIHKMAAVDPQAPTDGVFLAAFKVPSGCFCHVSHTQGSQKSAGAFRDHQNPSASGPEVFLRDTGPRDAGVGTQSATVTTSDEQNVNTFGNSRFTRNHNFGVESLPPPTSIQIGRLTNANSAHQSSPVRPRPTLVRRPPALPPFTTFHRHTSITISQPSPIVTRPEASPITPSPDSHPPLTPHPHTVFAPNIHHPATTFPPPISTTTFSSPVPSPKLVFINRPTEDFSSFLSTSSPIDDSSGQQFDVSSDFISNGDFSTSFLTPRPIQNNNGQQFHDVSSDFISHGDFSTSFSTPSPIQSSNDEHFDVSNDFISEDDFLTSFSTPSPIQSNNNEHFGVSSDFISEDDFSTSLSPFTPTHSSSDGQLEQFDVSSDFISENDFSSSFSTPRPTQSSNDEQHFVVSSDFISENDFSTSLSTFKPIQSSNGQQFHVSNDFISEEETGREPQESGELGESGVGSGGDNLQVSRAGDNNFILSLRQVRSDGLVVPLELVINVDGRLVSAASELASAATTNTAQSRQGVDRIDVDLQKLPRSVKRYVTILQEKAEDSKFINMSISQDQDLRVNPDTSSDSFVINAGYTKTVPSVELGSPTVSNISWTTRGHQFDNKPRPTQKRLTSDEAAQRTASLSTETQTPGIQHGVTFQPVGSPPSPADQILKAIDFPTSSTGISKTVRARSPSHENSFDSSTSDSDKISPLVKERHGQANVSPVPVSLLGSLITKAPHLLTRSTKAHNLRPLQLQTAAHHDPFNHTQPRLSHSTFLSGSHERLEEHSSSPVVRSVTVTPTVSRSEKDEDVPRFTGNQSTVGLPHGSGWLNPLLATQLYSDQPHVIQNYFIQVPESFRERSMTGSATREAPTYVALDEGLVNMSQGVEKVEESSNQPYADEQFLPELKNHRMTPTSSHYSILSPLTMKSKSKGKVPADAFFAHSLPGYQPKVTENSLKWSKRKRESSGLSAKLKSGTRVRTARETAGVARVRTAREAAGVARVRTAREAAGVARVRTAREAAGVARVRTAREAAGVARVRTAREAAGVARVRTAREAAGVARVRTAREAAGVARVRTAREAAGVPLLSSRKDTGVHNEYFQANEGNPLRKKMSLSFTKGVDPSSRVTSSDDEEKDVEVNIHFIFGSDTRTLNTRLHTPVVRDVSQSERGLKRSDPSRYSFLFSRIHDAGGNPGHSTNNHSDASDRPTTPHPWNRATGLTHTAADIPTKSSSAWLNVDEPRLFNPLFKMPARQIFRNAEQRGRQTAKCPSCRPGTTSSALRSKQRPPNPFISTNLVALADPTRGTGVTSGFPPLTDITDLSRGGILAAPSLVVRRPTPSPLPRPAHRSSIRFPGRKARRTLVHTVRRTTRPPRSLREFIMAPTPHPEVIVPHQRDRSSWKL